MLQLLNFLLKSNREEDCHVGEIQHSLSRIPRKCCLCRRDGIYNGLWLDLDTVRVHSVGTMHLVLLVSYGQ